MGTTTFRTEEALQAAVVKAVLKRYPEAWWFHPVGGPYQRPGIPDLLLCVHGLLVGIELKNPAPGESDDHARSRTTADQRRQIAAINRAGGMAGTAITVEEALEIVARGLDKRFNR